MLVWGAQVLRFCDPDPARKKQKSEIKKSAQRGSFRPDVPADIRPKTSVRPSKSGKNKHFGTDMPRGRPRKNFGLKNFGLIFRSLKKEYSGRVRSGRITENTLSVSSINQRFRKGVGGRGLATNSAQNTANIDPQNCVPFS